MKDGILKYKHRVIGALVLVALAVIFIPMVLTGQGSLDIGAHRVTIPAEREMPASSPPVIAASPTVELTEPPRGALVVPMETNTEPRAATESVTSVPIAPAPTEVPDTTLTTAPASKGAPAWAVQVGSFNNKNSAFHLRDTLRTKGFAAYVEHVSAKEGAIYRVRVGPELQRTLAEELQKKLAQAGQNGIVVSHH